MVIIPKNVEVIFDASTPKATIIKLIGTNLCKINIEANTYQELMKRLENTLALSLSDFKFFSELQSYEL